MKLCPLCTKEYESRKTCPDDGATLVNIRAKEDSFIGTILKNAYHIEEKIASGGMGTIYRAKQNPLGRDVAVKIILQNLQDDVDVVQRFYREAKLLSKLTHPNVVNIIDFGNTDNGLLFMVMEYLKGKTLKDCVPENKGLPMDELLDYITQICNGVSAAHSIHLIHRDLKPDNIFLAEMSGGKKVVKILDFGIARALDDKKTRLTANNVAAGTPGFLAPEQFEDAASADERSDIYAVGSMLYFMIGGTQAFSGKSSHTIVFRQLQEKSEILDFHKINKPKALERVYLKALLTDPAKRYQTANELLEDTFKASGISQPATGAFRSSPDVSETSSSGSKLTKWILSLMILFVVTGGGYIAYNKLDLKSKIKIFKISSGFVFRGVTDETILLGISAAYSGPAKELGREMRVGIEAQIKHINDQGGIHGRRIELIALDDGYEPDRALSNVKELLTQRKIFAMIGNVGTPTAKLTVPYAVENKLLFFGAFTGAGLLRKDPPDRYILNYRASYIEETTAMVDYFIDIRNVSPKKIAVFAQEDSYGDAGFEGVARTLRKRAGIDPKDILRIGYKRNTSDVSEAVKKTLENKKRIQAIVLVPTYVAASKYITQVRKGKMNPIFANVSFVGSRALAEEFQDHYGANFAEGVIVTQVVPHYKSNSTGVIRYREHLKKYYPMQSPSFVSLEGYIASTLLTEGIKRAGKELTTENLITAIENINNLDLGIGTQIHFGPSDHQGSHKVWGTVLNDKAEYEILNLN